MSSFIAQLVEHRTSIAEVTGSKPVEALIFIRLLLSNCLNCKIYCDDHSILSYRNIVGRNMLRAFCYPVKVCSDMLGIENRTSAHARVKHIVRGLNGWGGRGSHVGCRLKFHNFVGCRLKFSTFVGCQ